MNAATTPPKAARRMIALLAGAALAVSCGADYGKEGRDAFRRGEYRQAIDYLTVALRRSDDPELRHMKGLCLARLSYIDAAWQLLQPDFDDPERGPEAIEALVGPMILADRAADIAGPVDAAASRWPGNVSVALARSRIQTFRYDVELALLSEALAKECPQPHYQGLLHGARRLAARDDEEALAQYLRTFETRTGASASQKLISGIRSLRLAMQARQQANEAAIALTPEAYESLLDMGDDAAIRGDFAAAEAFLQDLISKDLADASSASRRAALAAAKTTAYGSLRQVYESQGKLDAAMSLLESGVADPVFANNPHVLFGNLCRLHYLSGNHDRVQAIAEQWLRINSQDPWPSFYKGAALYSKGEMDEAINYLERAQASAPKAALFNRMLGLAYIKVGDEIRGANALRKALLLQPQDVDTVLDLADAYKNSGELDRARALLSDGLKNQFREPASPAHIRLKAALVDLYQAAGQEIESVSEARLLHARNPDNPFVGLRLAQMEADAGNLDVATRLIARVQRSLPDLADGWRVGARVFLGAGRWTQALGALEKLAEIEPGDPALPWMRSEALLQLNRLDEARQQARQAIDRNPGAGGPYLVMMEIHRKAKDYPGVRRLAETLLVRFPEDRSILRAAAEARVEMEDFEGAYGPLQRLATLEQNDGGVALDFARTLLQLGRRDDAKREFSRAVSLFGREDIRRAVEAAEALAGLDRPAARSFLEDLARRQLPPALRTRVGVRLAYLRHEMRDYLGALDALVELRRGGEAARAFAVTLRLASLAGAHEVAAKIYSVLERQQLATDDHSRHAIPSMLAAGMYGEALRLVDSLKGRPSPLPVPVILQEAEALEGAGRRSEALARLKAAVSSMAPGDALPLQELRVSLLLRQQPREGLALLAEMAAAYPAEPSFVLAGVRAALARGDAQAARAGLVEALRRRASPEASLLLAGVEACLGFPAEALRRAEELRSPAASRVQDLLRSQVDRAPREAGGIAEALLILRGGQAAPSAEMVAAADPLPRSMASWLAGAANRIRGKQDSGKALSAAVFLATLSAEMPDLLPFARQRLREFAAVAPEIERELGALEAWLLLREGKPALAAGLLLPKISESAANPFETLLFAQSALANAGIDSVMTIIENTHGKGTLPALLCRDLALDLDNRGEHRRALQIIERSAEPDGDDALMQIRLRMMLRMEPSAQEMAARLSHEAARRSPLAFGLKLRSEITGPGEKLPPEFREELKSMAPRMSAAEALVAAEVSIRQLLEEDAQVFLARAIDAAPYDPAALQAILLKLRGLPPVGDWQEQIDNALSLLDPTATLRSGFSRAFWTAPR